MGRINILLVDDHAAMREELAALIEKQEDLDVVGQAADGEEGVSMAQQLHPDLIVMDVVMPGMNGIEATQAVKVSSPDVNILALSNHTGANLVKVLLEVGASGYVRKDHAYEELIPAIRAIKDGKQYIGQDLNK